MSDPARRDGERDAALDAAWRAHSTELPPAHLDAAILAAAHREARAKPRAIGDDEDALAEAREPSRAWWGLAAAATIGAIAFGLLQLAPDDAPLPTTASDMPATATPSQAPPSAMTHPGDGSSERASAMPDGAAPVPGREPKTRAPERATPAQAAKPSVQAQRSDDRVASVRPPEERGMTGAREASPPPSVPPPPVAASPKAPQAPPAHAEPSRPAAPATAPVAPKAFPGTAATDGTTATLAKRESEARDRAASDAIDSAARPAAPAPADASPRDERALRRQAPESSPALSLRTSLAPDAWAARIAALVDAGKRDEAERELAAFRDAYPDADERLPERLRAWAATVRRN